MSVCWTPMCEILVSKMFVCAMPYVLVPVVLQWDVIVLDDCLPDVFVMGASRVSFLYVCVYNVCLQDIYPRCLCIRRLCVCSISVCLMPKFEMSVCRMSVINFCLGNDCVALISFLWCDILSWIPRCGISVFWMAEFSFCPTTGCFTMRCHCLRWLCARCLCYGFISGVSVLYVRVYNVCL